MLYLIVAKPRTGKSQYAVSIGVKARQAGKPVYVTNFNQTDEQRSESGFIDFPDAKTWWDALPHGSVWIVDESQEVFPQRSKNVPLPDWIKQFSLHGHHDLTIYLITQDAMQLDVHLRRNTNFTLHLSRPLSGNAAKVYTFREYQEMPNDAWRRSQVLKAAESVEKFKYSEKWQRLYTSASAHDHIRRRFPKRLLILPVAVLVVGGLLWTAWDRLTSSAEKPSDANPTTAAVAAALTGAEAPSARGGGQSMTQEEWLVYWTPRLKEMPASAPAYDGFEPQDYPRVFCYLSGRYDECRCVTQQASRVDMDQTMCKLYVERGYFDPRRPAQSSSSVSQSVPAPGSSPQAVSAPPVAVGPGASPADASSASFAAVARYGKDGLGAY